MPTQILGHSLERAPRARSAHAFAGAAPESKRSTCASRHVPPAGNALHRLRLADSKQPAPEPVLSQSANFRAMPCLGAGRGFAGRISSSFTAESSGGKAYKTVNVSVQAGPLFAFQANDPAQPSFIGTQLACRPRPELPFVTRSRVRTRASRAGVIANPRDTVLALSTTPAAAQPSAALAGSPSTSSEITRAARRFASGSPCAFRSARRLGSPSPAWPSSRADPHARADARGSRSPGEAHRARPHVRRRRQRRSPRRWSPPGRARTMARARERFVSDLVDSFDRRRLPAAVERFSASPIRRPSGRQKSQRPSRSWPVPRSSSRRP
jgi:hypothetical protein